MPFLGASQRWESFSLGCRGWASWKQGARELGGKRARREDEWCHSLFPKLRGCSLSLCISGIPVMTPEELEAVTVSDP